jgi:hypothetical protein
MARRMTEVWFLRRIAWLAMLLPFLALSSLPAGVMPGRGEAGQLILVLCTADGPREMTVALGGDHNEAAHQGCPWALAHVAVVLPEATLSLHPVVVLPRDTVRHKTTDLLPAAIPGPRTARAPPAFA